jgi:hypothetical protein
MTTMIRTLLKTRSVAAFALGMALLGLPACISMPRPVPTQQQPLAQTQVGGVLVTVPRLDSGEFPSDVLDVATAVLVLVENRGTTEVVVDPGAFALGPAGGARYSPIPASQLAYRVQPMGLPSDTMLAWGGRVGGGISVRPAPVYRGGFSSGRVYTPAPAWRRPLPGYAPRAYYDRYPYGYLGAGPNLMWGYGLPGYWGGAYYMDGRPYAWSRAEAQRMSLPSAKLPPGARVSGFLFFPRLDVQEGTALELSFSLRDAATGQSLGEATLPLELRAD